MNPKKVVRHTVQVLTDLPNVGTAIEKDLLLIGIKEPSQLKGKSAYRMYDDLCSLTGKKHDPCVIDVFLSITHFINGAEPQPWWEYTRERKEYLQK